MSILSKFDRLDPRKPQPQAPLPLSSYPTTSFTLRTGAGYDYFEEKIWFDIVRKEFS